MNTNYKTFFIFIIGILLAAIILYSIFTTIEPFDNKNYLDGIDVIYWINLDRSPERRVYMETLLIDDCLHNIPNQRISAADGKAPEQLYSSLTSYNKQGRSDYEYACLISHIKTIEEFSKSNYKIALILEDDVTLEFKKYWSNSIKDIINGAPKDWEIIMLYYNCLYGDVFIANDFEKYDAKEHSCTVSYIINKKGADRFIASHVKNKKYVLNDEFDHAADHYIYGNINTYVYKYPFFTYKTENDSTIHSDHLSTHVYNKNKSLNAYKKFHPEIE
jgi:GR25 family glycosyltransferase involved in LPS biosynthesis